MKMMKMGEMPGKIGAEKLPELERKEKIEQLIEFALSEVKRKYGTGEGDGENPKYYHNYVHGADAVNAAKKIARLAFENGKISEEDVDLGAIAAAFHDIEQELGSGLNEEASAKIAEEKMREASIFSQEIIEKVKEMILATKVYFEDGVMRQSASEDFFTKIMADADLSALGDAPEIYWDRAVRLLKEIKNSDHLTKEDLADFAKSQGKFLSDRAYYTEEAAQAFPHLKDNIEYSRKKYKELSGSYEG